MLLMATMAFAQAPRRAANTNKQAGSTETRKEDKSVSNENRGRQNATTSRSSSATSRTERSSTRKSSDNINRENNSTSRSSREARSTTTTTRTTRTTAPRSTGTTSTTRTTSTPTRSTNTTSTTRSTQPRSTHSTTSTSRTRTTTSTPARSSTSRTTNVNRSGNPGQANSKTYSTTRTTTVRKPAYRASSARVYYPSSRRYTGTRTVVHRYSTPPRSRVYRSYHYPYRRPAHVEVIWTRQMHHHYIKLYPSVTYWHYPIGYRIETISAYDADLYMGEVMNVYGRITEVFYSRRTDEYFLYMGPYYPYQDLSIVVPGWIARKYSRRPVLFFEGQYLIVTGLISTYDGNPEIVVKKPYQIDVY